MAQIRKPFFTILTIHLAVTLLMTGLIWCIQLVHYPLFSQVLTNMTSSEFNQFESRHQARITPLVMPLMLVEAVTAVWLLFLKSTCFIHRWRLAICLNLLGLIIIWLSTIGIQVPIHQALSQMTDKSAMQEAISRLVQSNWIRTTSWSIRGLLLIFLIKQLCAPASKDLNQDL